MKKIYISTALTALSAVVSAQESGTLYYNFGRAGAITYATGPDSLLQTRGDRVVLKRKGQPLFFADAPAERKLQGEGALLFRDNAGYVSQRALNLASHDFVLECWAQVNGRQGAILGLPEQTTLLALGISSAAYIVYRENDTWMVSANGVPVKSAIGKAVPGEWVHLAIVVSDSKVTTWLNGQKTAAEEIARPVHTDTLFLGAFAGRAAFNGLIYDVRITALNGRKFNPLKDLHFNQQAVARGRKLLEDQRRGVIAAIAGNPLVSRLKSDTEQQAPSDWLVSHIDKSSHLSFQPSADGLSGIIKLSNGLISREFYIGDNIACISYKNLSNGAQYLRAVKPEARIRLDSTWYDIGGLTGQPEKSYLLNSWLEDMVYDPAGFQFAGLEIRQPEARYHWQQKFNAVHTEWPPKGIHVVMNYDAPVNIPEWKQKLRVAVHYEMYDGIPVLAKWITISNGTGKPVLVNETECEVLAVTQDQEKRIHMESDYSFALANADKEGSALMHYKGEPPAYQVGGSTTKWLVDPEYNTWATHNQAEDRFLAFPHHSLLVSRLPMGPSELLAPQGCFNSFTTFELLHDSDDKERQSLAHRRFYRTLAPQVTESLLTGGITSHDRTELKHFITQMGELGFERLDVMAWPGISHDNLDTAYIALWKEIAGFAKERGIVMGGYELQVASRGRGADVDCIDPATGKPGSLFGQSVCVASGWKDTYYPAMWKFFDRTGFMTYNIDGPYHGDVCASVIHPHHYSLNDSQWKQWQTQVEVLHELQKRNMYAPMPDWYFLNGQSATGMGYREASANLTPQQQLLLGRQYIYDGTWHKTPTMGGMVLQLVGFYTNDPRVGLEPLADNLSRYETGLFQHLASGCQLTIRGKRLYDTPDTKAMVKHWIAWFKQYRDILTSDIIHIGRPDGRDIDLMLHVNPDIRDKGMLIAFNPTDHEITKNVKVPLYYTGIKQTAVLTGKDGKVSEVSLKEGAVAEFQMTLPAGGFSWYLLRQKD
ncbi:LamG domain-containing protein [Chitinophaga sp. Ak27]|uniref:LamG domain-containing protein n=1 Tax=Chitinophaga sp. Ak27 TaxID=2726116 RepID=UPI00145CD3AC|nr:LamG domain-containing protein [Chitinophaga sp. Ak27]NLU93074.1 LamG domain-containing protein [Chitinophaga sp. Ak27]